jgi:hypothetical protein
MSFGGPLDEPDLRNELRPYPLHLAHLVGRDAAAAPMAALAVREIDEGTWPRMERLELLSEFPSHVRRHTRANLAGAAQLPPDVVADNQRVDRVIGRPIPADHKLLLSIESELEPRVAACAWLVARIPSLGDHAFKAETAHGGGHLRSGAGKF